MISNEIQKLLPKIRECLSSQPVEKAWLFGSCSRGEEHSDSDIDLLVRYKRDGSFSLMTIARIIVNLEKTINKSVDLIEKGRLLPFARKSANHDKILIYEREG